MENAPYLSNAIALVTPIFTYWEIPYMWAGLKVGLKIYSYSQYPLYRQDL